MCSGRWLMDPNCAEMSGMQTMQSPCQAFAGIHLKTTLHKTGESQIKRMELKRARQEFQNLLKADGIPIENRVYWLQGKAY